MHAYNIYHMRILLIWLIGLAVAFTSCDRESSKLGDKYFNEGKYELAIEEYSEYLKLRPKHIKTLYNRGRAYEEMAIYDRALEDFKKVTELDENNDNAYLSIGKYYYSQDSFDKAGLYFDKAIDINERNAMAYYLKARVYHTRGLFREALEGYSTSINFDSKLGEAYLYRGALKVSMKQRKGACNDFKVAKSLNVKDAEDAIRKYCN